jgi:hypothetical protein
MNFSTSQEGCGTVTIYSMDAPENRGELPRRDGKQAPAFFPRKAKPLAGEFGSDSVPNGC